MPHQRKYVAHSGGIDACPSRAKRSMAAYASHGFSSRLSSYARCALLSFTSLTLASAETEAGGRVVTVLTPSTSAQPPPSNYIASPTLRHYPSRTPTAGHNN